MNILGNASLTSAQQQRAMEEAWIPGAKTFHDFIDALEGTTEKLRKQEVYFTILDARRQAAGPAQMQRGGVHSQKGVMPGWNDEPVTVQLLADDGVFTVASPAMNPDLSIDY